MHAPIHWNDGWLAAEGAKHVGRSPSPIEGVAAWTLCHQYLTRRLRWASSWCWRAWQGSLASRLRFRAVAVSNTHPWHRSSPQPKPVEPQDALHMCKPHLHLLAREMTAGMPRCRPARSALAAKRNRTLPCSEHCGAYDFAGRRLAGSKAVVAKETCSVRRRDTVDFARRSAALLVPRTVLSFVYMRARPGICNVRRSVAVTTKLEIKGIGRPWHGELPASECFVLQQAWIRR
jgi:hypothetical protein